ncbi:uncharacterized protein C12orf56 isoform X1 [Octopus bimaculoides]|uniref:Uncharacterized protein n=2 Tax=Octopus bimaculoides TaxID=37653 RepID=A0A0L8FVY5_OCTBM|nr:uncharacterized protein C12orf56 isoform X1 [Octopus bimaculoides]|eukprot:XP_014786448.1 PREDICTED: uncharacterized protein C12orf56-like isoform X1 [Octopus bimaculoides]
MLDPSSGTQRNNKLECFLKRTLPSERYNRLRAYEACIVDKTFKYIIVGDQCIYLTENPPRTLQPVIFYQELRDVQLEYDLPNFLQGLEREQTLHIVLTYSRNLQKTTQDGASSDIRQSQSSLFLNTLFTKSQPSKAPTNHRKSSFDETLLQSSRSIVDHSMDGSNTLLSTSLPSNLWHTLEKNGNGTNTSEEISIGKCKYKPSLIHRIRKPFSRVWYNFLNIKRHGMLKNRHSTSKVRLKIDEDSDIDSKDENESRLPSPRDISESKTKTLRGSKVSHNPGKSSNAMQVYVLNVYLLKNNSPSLDLIRYAWDNYLIRSTEQQSNRRCTDVSTQDSQSLSVQPEVLFVRIKQELLSENDYSDVLFFLCSRLHTSALSCFTIKKLFWKDPELFMFFVGILCKYVPGFVSNGGGTVCDSKDDNKLQSLLCLVLEILRVMFRETEVLSSRISTLVAAKEGVFELMKILISLLSRQPAPIRKRNQSQSVKSSIPLELTELSISVIFELFVCVQQKLDGSKEDICTSWLVGVVEDIGAEDLICGMVSQVLELTKPTSSGNNCVEVSCLLPLQVLKLYQHYYILAVILENSSQLAEYIHSNYLSEFKYLVQVPVLKQRLSTHCPLSNTVLQLIVKVLQKIVH